VRLVLEVEDPFLREPAHARIEDGRLLAHQRRGLALHVEIRLTADVESHGPLRLFVDDTVVDEQEIRTISRYFALCGEGLCIGYDDGGDAVSSLYAPPFDFHGGEIIKVVFDVADDAYVDVERHLAAAIMRD
jgi:hypothetical protein